MIKYFDHKLDVRIQVNVALFCFAYEFFISYSLFRYYDLNLLVNQCHYSVFTIIYLFGLQWTELFDKGVLIIGVL